MQIIIKKIPFVFLSAAGAAAATIWLLRESADSHRAGVSSTILFWVFGEK